LAAAQPNPDSPENEFREEHYRRIAYANEHLPPASPVGRPIAGIFISLSGKPDSIESHPSGGSYQRPIEEGGGETSTFPFEIWNYRYLEASARTSTWSLWIAASAATITSPSIAARRTRCYTCLAPVRPVEEMGMAKKADRFKGGLENWRRPAFRFAGVQGVRSH